MRNRYLLVLFTILLAFSANSQVFATGSSYEDITTSYAKEAIIELTDKGIMTGITAQKFYPKSLVSRGEFVVILAKAIQLPVDLSLISSNIFTDVQGEITPYIIAAYEAGLIEGVGNNKFGADDLLTREQTAKLLSLGYANKLDTVQTDLELADLPFTDTNKIANWALPYIAHAVHSQLLSGHANGSFDPKSNITREMTAQMIANLLHKLDSIQSSKDLELSLDTEKLSPDTTLHMEVNYPPSISTTVQPVHISITGKLSPADMQLHSKLHVTIHGVTTKDINFNANNPLGKPEIIQEGADLKPLIAVWGGDNGVKLADYTTAEQTFHFNLDFEVSVLSNTIKSANFDFKTVEDSPQSLVKKSVILPSSQREKNTPNPTSFIKIELGEPLSTKVGQAITIPVKILGNSNKQTAQERLELEVRLLQPPSNLQLSDISAEAISYFGHAQSSFTARKDLLLRFDRLQPLSDIEDDLKSGITFDLILYIQKPGKYSILPTIIPTNPHNQSISVNLFESMQANTISFTIEP